MRQVHRRGFAALLALVAATMVVASAGAYSTTPAYTATDFVTGIPSQGGNGVGPVGLAFDSTNHLWMMDYHTGVLYKFDGTGGAADAAHQVTVGSSPWGGDNAAGLAFSKSGRLYVAVQGSWRVDEVDMSNGQIARTVASNIYCATGIATDPISGDLVATSPCGAASYRISHFEDGGPVAVSNIGGYPLDGITFAPDGTIYGAYAGQYVLKLAGTDQPSPGSLQRYWYVPTSDGTAVSVSSDPSQPSYIFANRNDGTVTRIDPSDDSQVNIFTGGSRGDFSTVGPDGCLYITQTSTVVKITNADGTCSLAPTTALPTLSLAPATSTHHVGESDTLTATLANVASPAGTPVTFTVTGANSVTQTVAADASGVATFTYSGTHTGTDHVTASTTIGTQSVSSNVADVEWLAPLDVTPPAITPVVDGTLGTEGWYTSPVTITWIVTDPESGIASSSGCDPSTLSVDTASASRTCTAVNGVGLSASATATVKIDQSAPTVTYSTHPATYDVDATVSITCAAADALSGVASSDCSDVSSPAWALGLGSHGLSASATDHAGNTGTGATSFTVVVTSGGLCALVQQWVTKSGVANSFCVKLDNAAAAGARGSAGAKANLLDAFRNELAAQSGKSITAAHAATLTELSRSL